MRVWKVSIICVLLAMLALLAMLMYAGGAGIAYAADEKDINTISVTGTGTIYAEPDIAKIDIGVVTEGNTSSEAMMSNNLLAEAVSKAVKAEGIPVKDIKTSRVSVEPIYTTEKRPDSYQETQRISGYRATNTVTVTVRDMTKIGPVIDAGYTSGANQIGNVQFTFEDATYEKLYSDALKKAVKSAKSKAKLIADESEVSNIKLKSITENTAGPVPVYYGSGGYGMSAMEAKAPTPVSPGEQKIEASVTMVYKFD